MLPNFLVIGAKKSGTSWLRRQLEYHPDIWFPPMKEIHYFDVLLPFCLPLALGIHQGLIHIGKQDDTKQKNETLGSRVIQMALEFAIRHNLPCVLTLDAFFSKPSCV